MYVSLLGPVLFCIRLSFCIGFRVPEGAQGSQGTQGVLQTGKMCCAHDSVPHKFHNTPTKGLQIMTTTLHPNSYVCMYVKTNKKTQTAGQRSFSHNDAKPSTSKLHDVPRKRKTNTLMTVN